MATLTEIDTNKGRKSARNTKKAAINTDSSATDKENLQVRKGAARETKATAKKQSSTKNDKRGEKAGAASSKLKGTSRKRSASDRENDAESNESSVKKRKIDTKKLHDVVSMPELDGEASGQVPIFDTCNDVRTKIDTYLRKHSLSKAAFAREITKCQGTPSTPVTPGQVTSFQRKKGPLAGNSSKAFYASYVFFEKLRLKEGRSKTKKRQEMEEVHGENGVMTDRPIENVHFILPMGRRVYIDKYAHLRG